MNLAFVIGTFVPEHVGGTETQAAELARRLAVRHRVSVLTRREGRGAVIPEPLGGAVVYRHPVPARSRLRSLRALLAKRRTLAGLDPRPDLLLCYHLVDAGLFGRILRVACRIPYVLWLRSELDLGLLETHRGGVIARSVLANASGVFSQSEGLGRRLVDALRIRGRSQLADRVASRLTIAGNGVETSPGPRVAGSSNGTSPRDERTILFAGRLRADKGIFDLLEAASRIPGVRLVFAGDGPERARLARESQGRAVTVRGILSAEVLREEMERATLLCLPSWHEGLPNVILEAQAAGLPVVSTRVGAIPEIVDDGRTGLLLPPRDPAALAAALGRALSDTPLRDRFAAEGRANALCFAWEPLLERVESALQAAVRNP